MLIYFFVIICIIVLSFFFSANSKNNNEYLFLFLSFLLLSLIAGLRSIYVGADTIQFVHVFDYINKINISDFSKLRFEYGFSFLCWILGKIFNRSQSLIVISSLFINFSVMFFIKNNSKNVYISTLLYILGLFYFSYMNIMRQAIAIGIVLLGYEELKRNRIIIFLLYVFSACLFHSSAILCLLFIPMNKMKYSKKLMFLSIIFMIFSFLFGNYIFNVLCKMSPRLHGYIGGEYDVSNFFGALIKSVVILLVYFLGILIIGNPKDNAKLENDKNLNFLFLAMGIACIFSVLVMRVSIFNRFYPYFLIFQIIWIPNVISTLKISKNRWLLYLIIILFFIIYCFTILYFRPEWLKVSNYLFYWE